VGEVAMTLEEFAALVPGLTGMSHVDKIKHLAWFALTQDRRERFATAGIRRYYEQLHFEPPGNLSQLIVQLTGKKPPEVLKDKSGFRLHARVKEQLDAKYALRPIQVAVPAMLQSLVGKVSDEAERLFLTETITCYKGHAFRATVVMVWNLAYDHLLNYILTKRLADFNAAIARRYPKKAGLTITEKDDFLDELKEFEVIEIASTGGVVADNMKKILNDKLIKRNMAAHPSAIVIESAQAEDSLTDLVNNVILKLG
jgi:hypothetical protein